MRAKADRTAANAGHDFAATGISITPCPPAARFVLRGTADALANHTGFDLPATIGTSTSQQTRHVLMLGPDEWLALDTEDSSAIETGALPDSCTVVDVSHRNTGWSLSGPNAALALAVGCPRDLRDAAFPVGGCARTIFGKAEVVLHRTGPETWRVECWRSFAPYVFALLKEGAKDAHL